MEWGGAWFPSRGWSGLLSSLPWGPEFDWFVVLLIFLCCISFRALWISLGRTGGHKSPCCGIMHCRWDGRFYRRRSGGAASTTEHFDLGLYYSVLQRSGGRQRLGCVRHTSGEGRGRPVFLVIELVYSPPSPSPILSPPCSPTCFFGASCVRVAPSPTPSGFPMGPHHPPSPLTSRSAQGWGEGTAGREPVTILGGWPSWGAPAPQTSR